MKLTSILINKAGKTQTPGIAVTTGTSGKVIKTPLREIPIGLPDLGDRVEECSIWKRDDNLIASNLFPGDNTVMIAVESADGIKFDLENHTGYPLGDFQPDNASGEDAEGGESDLTAVVAIMSVDESLTLILHRGEGDEAQDGTLKLEVDGNGNLTVGEVEWEPGEQDEDEGDDAEPKAAEAGEGDGTEPKAAEAGEGDGTEPKAAEADEGGSGSSETKTD